MTTNRNAASEGGAAAEQIGDIQSLFRPVADETQARSSNGNGAACPDAKAFAAKKYRFFDALVRDGGCTALELRVPSRSSVVGPWSGVSPI